MERRFFIAAMIVLTAAFIVSCTEDLEVNNGGQEQGRNAITFTVDESQDWYQTQLEKTPTRSLGHDDFSAKTIDMQSVNGGKTDLKMTATVVNGIDSKGITGATATRGTATTDKPGSFTVNAYVYDDDTPSWTNWFYNEQAVQSSPSSSNWVLSQARYWPSDLSTLMRFYGYALASGTAATLSHSPAASTAAPYIDYTVQTTVADQADLMTAATAATRFHGGDKVEMEFKHALTCVKFVAGAGLANCTIKRISLENIVKSGRYDYNGNWTAGTDSANFDMSQLNFSVGASTNVQIVSSTGDDCATTMLMIPQQFGSDKQRIEISYDDGSGNKLVQASLNGTAWLPGTTVTYNLSVTNNYEYVLNVTPITIGPEGGTTSFSVTSYRQASGGSPESLPWHIIGYSTDGVNFTQQKTDDCSWVGITKLEGTGGVIPTTSQVLILEQTSKTAAITAATDDATVMAAYMKLKGERGSEENPFDLSTHDFKGNTTLQNTANCYVINAPGWYKLPLVYGNAIKDGAINEDAYTAGTVNNNYKNYPNYVDGYIETPYVYDAATPNSAKLVWEDADGLITTDNNYRLGLCNLVGSKATYLKFYINPDNIKPGNAIVAVCDGAGLIMWSWHIWVTAEDISQVIPITNYQNTTYNLMPVTLGWCSLGTGLQYYDGRQVWVKIQQDGGKTAVFSISQPEGTANGESEIGYAPFYQWGRKDPIAPGVGGTSTANRTVYGPDQPDYTTASTAQTYGYSIQHPNRMVVVAADWSNPVRLDAWCAKNTIASSTNTVKVIKTIYDPSPVGFHVPETNAFTGFATNGGNTTGANNILHEKVSNGFYFYTDATKTKTVHFPANGSRETLGYGNIWNASIFGTNLNCTTSNTAVLVSASQGHPFLWADVYSNTYHIWSLGWNYTSRAIGVRPVQDY